jgi:hypothetical protein
MVFEENVHPWGRRGSKDVNDPEGQTRLLRGLASAWTSAFWLILGSFALQTKIYSYHKGDYTSMIEGYESSQATEDRVVPTSKRRQGRGFAILLLRNEDQRE